MTATDRLSESPPLHRPPDVPLRRLLTGGLGLIAVLALAVVVGGGEPASIPPELDRAGPLVDHGLPVVTLAGRISAVGTVGSLLFAALLRPERTLPPASRRAVQAASGWAWAWAGTTVLGAVLTVSRLVGVSPASLPASSVQTFVTDLPAGRAALVVGAVAAVLALGSRRCRSDRAARLLLAVAVVGLVVPAVLTGHSSAADNHEVAVSTLAVHVVAAAVWAGGLLALIRHGRGSDDLIPAAARFSAVAQVCFVVTGASGVLAAGLVLGGTGALPVVWDTGYGWLLIAKAVALVALGAFGWHHRRRTLPRLRAGQPRSFRRFAAVETGVLLATVAVAVALAGSPPPPSPSTGPPPAAEPAAVTPPPEGTADDMAGHDHGELSVAVLIEENGFHVSRPVTVGSRVTVHNSTPTEFTITAEDGSFDVVVRGRTLITFEAPDRPGRYPFTSRHSASFADVLVVR